MATSSVYAKVKDMAIVPDNRREWMEFLSHGGPVIVKRMTRARTDRQNRSLHLWFELVARELDSKGMTIDMAIGGRTVKLSPTGVLIKEAMWRPVQMALLGKASTRELSKTSDIDLVFDNLNRFFTSDPLGIHVPWPAEDSNDSGPQVERPTEDAGRMMDNSKF